MGDLRPNNGGEPSPDDGGTHSHHSGDLPDFPPEWGPVVIPDDASELDFEAQSLRRELRRHARRGLLRTRLGLAPGDGDGPSLGVPVIVMAVAIVTTLLSLFVVTWDRSRISTVPPTTSGNPTPAAVVDVVLADAGGDRVRLGDLLPAVILLTDGCDCADLIAALAKAAPRPVTVIPVGRTAPCPVGGPANVRCLADPDASLTARFASAGAGPAQPSGAAPSTPAVPSTAAPPLTRSAAAVLVDSAGATSGPTIIDAAADIDAGLNGLG